MLDTQAYVPRPVVGRYLVDLLAHARRKAAERGLTLDLIAEEVVDIAPPGAPGQREPAPKPTPAA